MSRARLRSPYSVSLTTLALAGLTAALAPGDAPAVELRDAELVAAGAPVLRNDAGGVRLEDARLGRIGPTVFVPEPGSPWPLVSVVGTLALLARRRFAGRSTRRGPR